MIDPHYRNKCVFTRLLTKALKYLQNINIVECTVICNENDVYLNDLMRKGGMACISGMSEWQAPVILPAERGCQPIIIEQAQVDDINSIVEINHQCFPKGYHGNLEKRLINNMQQCNRQIYIAKSENKVPIGKLHVREEDAQVIIHEVGVLPTFQRKGYGRSLMIKWLYFYAAKYQPKPIIVEVLNNNIAGFALYSACGFTQKDNHILYTFNVNDLLLIIRN